MPLVCLQHYQSAEPARELEGGGMSLHVYAHTYTQIHTHLSYMLHGATRQEAKPLSAHIRYPELVLYLSVSAAFALSVCLSLSGCLCSGMQARISAEIIRNNPWMCGLEAEQGCIISDLDTKQGSATFPHWNGCSAHHSISKRVGPVLETCVMNGQAGPKRSDFLKKISFKSFQSSREKALSLVFLFHHSN